VAEIEQMKLLIGHLEKAVDYVAQFSDMEVVASSFLDGDSLRETRTIEEVQQYINDTVRPTDTGGLTEAYGVHATGADGKRCCLAITGNGETSLLRAQSIAVLFESFPLVLDWARLCLGFAEAELIPDEAHDANH
jgi:hypothetical protein